MTWRRFRRLVCLLAVVKVLLYLPRSVEAHGGHGLGGVAASILFDTATSTSGGCTETAQ